MTLSAAPPLCTNRHSTRSRPLVIIITTTAPSCNVLVIIITTADPTCNVLVIIITTADPTCNELCSNRLLLTLVNLARSQTNTHSSHEPTCLLIPKPAYRAYLVEDGEEELWRHHVLRLLDEVHASLVAVLLLLLVQRGDTHLSVEGLDSLHASIIMLAIALLYTST